LPGLAATLPELRAVGFNGGKSASLGVSQLSGRRDLALIPLPSSSPAFTLPFDSKLEAWIRLRDFLPGG
jgi:G:T/U-mismatch repair DNA glycosylase